MKPSALSKYLDRHANRLDPEQKQLLAQLPDDAIEQAYAYFFGPVLLPWLDMTKTSERTSILAQRVSHIQAETDDPAKTRRVKRFKAQLWF